MVGDMGHEREIKLRVEDMKAFRVKLQGIGARVVTGGAVAGRTGRVHEWNVLFDTTREDLRRRGELLRIRRETGKQANSSGRQAKAGRHQAARVLVTYKRAVTAQKQWSEQDRERSRHKVREEIELEVADAAALTTIFEGLGMRGWFRYEKFRTTFRLPESQRWAKGLLIELDETPIGTFVELEGTAKAIDRAARALGFNQHDYITTNYLSLFRAECQRRGETPTDMVFQKRH